MQTQVIISTKPSADNIRLFTTDHPDIPVPNKERIQFLDILRGIAILFILVANIRVLSGEYFIPDITKGSHENRFPGLYNGNTGLHFCGWQVLFCFFHPFRNWLCGAIPADE
jgi:hypothetical protein